MYVTLRDQPGGDAGKHRRHGPRGKASDTSGTQRVAGTVVVFGVVSLFTDISSESVSAILPIYLTSILGFSALAYGFIDGIYQGVSAMVRILGGWVADRTDHPKWVAFSGWVPVNGEVSRASGSTMPCRRVSSASVKPVPTLPA